jgi:glutathione peroxidase-family protein
MPGAVMPDIKGLTPEGKPFMKDALKGKITLVVFWASWARGSQEDFLSLKQLHDRYHSKGFEILAIAVDKYEGRWKKAIAYNQLNWLHAADFKGAYSENLEAFGTNKLPSYFMVGPDLKFVDDNIAIAGVEAYINDYLRALPTK